MYVHNPSRVFFEEVRKRFFRNGTVTEYFLRKWAALQAAVASGRKKSENVEIKSQRPCCSIGSSTLTAPIKALET